MLLQDPHFVHGDSFLVFLSSLALILCLHFPQISLFCCLKNQKCQRALAAKEKRMRLKKEREREKKSDNEPMTKNPPLYTTY